MKQLNIQVLNTSLRLRKSLNLAHFITTVFPRESSALVNTVWTDFIQDCIPQASIKGYFTSWGFHYSLVYSLSQNGGQILDIQLTVWLCQSISNLLTSPLLLQCWCPRHPQSLELWHIYRSSGVGMLTSTPQGLFQVKWLSNCKILFKMFSRLLGKLDSVEISLRKLWSYLNSLRKATIPDSFELHQALQISLLSRVSNKSWHSIMTWFQMLGIISALLRHFLGPVLPSFLHSTHTHTHTLDCLGFTQQLRFLRKNFL